MNPATSQTLDLGGEWEFRRDPTDLGVSDGWATHRFTERTRFPAPTPRKRRRPDTKSPQTSEGPVWFSREFELPGWWQGQRVVLALEQLGGDARVWLDGVEAAHPMVRRGAQEFDLTDGIVPGHHRVTLLLDSKRASRAGTPAVGQSAGGRRVELRATPKVWIDDVEVVPIPGRNSVRVVVTVGNRLAGRGEGSLTLSARRVRDGAFSTPARLDATIGFGESRTETEYLLGREARKNRERKGEPELYELTVSLYGTVLDRGVSHEATVRFSVLDVGKSARPTPPP